MEWLLVILAGLLVAVVADLIVRYINKKLKTPRPGLCLGEKTNLVVADSPEIDREKLVRELDAVKLEYPAYKPPETKLPSGALISFPQAFSEARRQLSQPSEKEIERYDGERYEYFDQYEKYLFYQEELRHARKSRILTLDINIRNKRNNLHHATVRLHFPYGMQIIGKDDLPDELEEPEPPTRPRTTPQMIRGPYLTPIQMPQMPTPEDASPFDIKEVDSWEVNFPIDFLMHHSTEPYGMLYVIFPSFNSVKKFYINYRIHAENIPKVRKGRYKIKPVKIPLSQSDAASASKDDTLASPS